MERGVWKKVLQVLPWAEVDIQTQQSHRGGSPLFTVVREGFLKGKTTSWPLAFRWEDARWGSWGHKTQGIHCLYIVRIEDQKKSWEFISFSNCNCPQIGFSICKKEIKITIRSTGTEMQTFNAGRKSSILDLICLENPSSMQPVYVFKGRTWGWHFLPWQSALASVRWLFLLKCLSSWSLEVSQGCCRVWACWSGWGQLPILRNCPGPTELILIFSHVKEFFFVT